MERREVRKGENDIAARETTVLQGGLRANGVGNWPDRRSAKPERVANDAKPRGETKRMEGVLRALTRIYT